MSKRNKAAPGGDISEIVRNLPEPVAGNCLPQSKLGFHPALGRANPANASPDFALATISLEMRQIVAGH